MRLRMTPDGVYASFGCAMATLIALIAALVLGLVAR